MEITRKVRDSSDKEESILAGIILSDHFATTISKYWNPENIECPHYRRLCQMALDYNVKYEKAPGKAILTEFADMVGLGQLDDANVQMMRDRLRVLFETYSADDADKFNTQFYLDRAITLFRQRNLKRLAEDLSVDAQNQDVEKGEARLENFQTVGMTSMGKGRVLFGDAEAMANAFDKSHDILFSYPGAVGRMINNDLRRGNFIAFTGPEKRGKSWMLIDAAMRAWMGRCNVAFFETGDMDLDNIEVRCSTWLGKQPVRPDDIGKPIIVPCADCKWNQDGSCGMPERASTVACGVGNENAEGKREQVWKLIKEMSPYDVLLKADKKYVPCTHCKEHGLDTYAGTPWWKLVSFDEPLDWRSVWKQDKNIRRLRLRNKHIHLQEYVSHTASVTTIKKQLRDWERMEKFVPDVIIIDYADLLKSDKRRNDVREEVEDVWVELRGLAMSQRALVITATQANAAAYEADTLGMQNFSQNKRKNAHVTGNIGLNQTDLEKRHGIMRWNWICRREDGSNARDYVTLLQCLKLGQPVLDSW